MLPDRDTLLPFFFFVSVKEEKFKDVPETFAAWRKVYVSAETQIDRKKIVEQFKYELLLQKRNIDFMSGDRTIFIEMVESLLESPMKKAMMKRVVALFRKVFNSMFDAKSVPDEDNDDVIILDVDQPDSEMMDKNIKEKIDQNTAIGNKNVYYRHQIA